MKLPASSRLLLLGAVVAGFGFGLWWLGQPSNAVVPLPTATPTVVAGGEAIAAPATVIVDVVGAVRSPGVVELPVGARVLDAVNAAGGLRPGKRAGVNLARKLVDGEQISVGTTNESASGSGSAGLLNLNSASASELDQLPGIGPVLAGRIVEYRDRHGPFRSANELDNVTGVGPAVLADLLKLVTVG